MTERAAVAQSRYATARRWVIKPSLALGLLLLLLAGYAEGRHHTTHAATTLAAAMIVAGSGLGYTCTAPKCRDRSDLRVSVTRLRGPVVLVDHAATQKARSFSDWTARNTRLT